jgi:hypothetical protein
MVGSGRVPVLQMKKRRTRDRRPFADAAERGKSRSSGSPGEKVLRHYHTSSDVEGLAELCGRNSVRFVAL